MKKILTTVTAILIAALSLTSCGIGVNNNDPDASPEVSMSAELKELTQNTVDATIVLDNGDEINLELYPDLAPETVENFISLADDGFYDGTIFHRVIDGFVIQGGGYDEDLNELKADTVEGEFFSNGFDNELSHTRGVISMARAQDPDSATSQFFIVQQDATSLDGDYAAFGRVTDDESMDVVDDIASVKTGTSASAGLSDVPITPVVIKTIKINASASSLLDDDDDKMSNPDKDDDDDDKSSKTGTSDRDDDDNNDNKSDKSGKTSSTSKPDSSSDDLQKMLDNAQSAQS